MGKKEQRKRARLSEPEPEGDDWIDWCGYRIFAVGFTPGGAPYGLTEEEFREANARSEYLRSEGWAVAKHVLSRVLELHGCSDAEKRIDYIRFLNDADEALKWARNNLPPAEVCRLVHGDLLGQNLLCSLEGAPTGILDWGEAVVGDPAYDLAIICRGVRRPFGENNGLDLLLEAYNSGSNVPLSRQEVHLYELYLLANFYLQACEQLGSGSAHAGQKRQNFVNASRRIRSD